MALTRSDKEDIQQMFDTGIDHIKEMQAEHWKLFDEKLNRLGDGINVVDQKVSKTNGSVLKHEKQLTDLEKNLPHTKDGCAQKDVIQMLYDAHKVSNGVSKWKVGLIAVVSSVMGSILTGIAIFEFILKYKH